MIPRNSVVLLFFVGVIVVTLGISMPPASAAPVPAPSSQQGDDAYPPPLPSEPVEIEVEEEKGPEPSELARLAIDYVAQRHKLPVEQIQLVNEYPFQSQIRTDTFQIVSMVDSKGPGIFHTAVDLATKEVLEYSDLEAQELQLYEEAYGKFEPALQKRLDAMSATDTITVVFILADPIGEEQRKRLANEQLAAKYPEVAAALEGGLTIFDLEDPELQQQVRQDFEAILFGDLPQRRQPLIDAIAREAKALHTFSFVPAVSAVLSKATIVETAQREDIHYVFANPDGYGVPAMQSATLSNRTQAVWNRNINGTGTSGNGVRIAILEKGFVKSSSSTSSGNCLDGNNCFLRTVYTRTGTDPGDTLNNDHATLVASVAASNHPTYKGVAPGARIVSAPIFLLPGETEVSGDGMIQALEWAMSSLGGNVDVINQSYIFCNPDHTMMWLDWAYDYLVGAFNRLVTVSTGNSLQCGDHYVLAPGRAHNVLAVGAYNDNNTGQWSDDAMSWFSSWKNPVAVMGAHEKPEVVAPGELIYSLHPNGVITGPRLGTSLAAPQVAAQAALMVHRNYLLSSRPTAARAIIMASATHNISQTTGIQPGTDHWDGAGAINIDLSDLTARKQLNHSQTCPKNCWWQETITPSSFDGAGYRYYSFQGKAGDRVRIAAAWEAHHDCTTATSGCVSSHNLAVNLDLRVKDPNGNFLSTTSSALNNAYELLPQTDYLTLPMNGTYQIAVHRQKFDSSKDPSTPLGVAITHVPPASGTYDAQHHAYPGATIYMPDGGAGSGWGTTTPAALAAWETSTYTGDVGKRAAFSFNGDRISLLYTMANNRGNYKVYIDGVLRGHFNGYTPETRRQVIRTWSGLGAGDHTIEVEAAGGGLMDVDAFAVNQEYVSNGVVDDVDPMARFIGSWEALTGITTPAPGAYFGTMKRARLAGQVVRITFYGSRITWYHSRDYTRGSAAITFDGVDYGTVNHQTSGTFRRQSYDLFVPTGHHTLHITVLGIPGCSGPSYCDSMIDVDAFVVTP